MKRNDASNIPLAQIQALGLETNQAKIVAFVSKDWNDNDPLITSFIIAEEDSYSDLRNNAAVEAENTRINSLNPNTLNEVLIFHYLSV